MSDTEKVWLKNWLASVSIVMVLQIGSLIWFLATQHAEQVRLARTMDRIEPQHAEIYYYFKNAMTREGAR